MKQISPVPDGNKHPTASELATHALARATIRSGLRRQDMDLVRHAQQLDPSRPPAAMQPAAPRWKIDERADLDGMVTHLTKSRIVGDDPLGPTVRLDPMLVLIEILSDGVLRGGRGCVWGKEPVVCLTETPLSQLPQLVGYRFAPYGIRLDKAEAEKVGAASVIYERRERTSWIPEDKRWRTVPYDDRVDFRHEREWRVRGDLDLTCMSFVDVVVATEIEAAFLMGRRHLFFPSLRHVSAIKARHDPVIRA